MGLPMKTRQQLAMEVARRYRRASRSEKGKILDDVAADTGYTRAYAGIVLRKCGLKLLYAMDEEVVEAEARVVKPHGGGRPRVYTDEVRQAAISPATVDRLLQRRRAAMRLNRDDSLSYR